MMGSSYLTVQFSKAIKIFLAEYYKFVLFSSIELKSGLKTICIFKAMAINKILISVIISLSALQFLSGQDYTVGDYVDDFSGDICFNGDGTWSYDTHGRDRVTWVNLFTSW